jgi:hypothetical protein
MKLIGTLTRSNLPQSTQAVLYLRRRSQKVSWTPKNPAYLEAIPGVGEVTAFFLRTLEDAQHIAKQNFYHRAFLHLPLSDRTVEGIVVLVHKDEVILLLIS